ncbi:MAG: DUF928 domain-containing protein [Bacteroidota bacterium]
MNRARHIITFILFLFLADHALGQVTFQFVPEIYGRNVNGLFNCRIINPTGKRTATLTIAVSEKKSGQILLVKSSPFAINPGTNAIPSAAIRNAAIAFSSNSIGVIVRHDHNFPIGDYEYCFTLNFTDRGNDAIAEQCFDQQLVPFAELNLIEPFNKDSICEKRPMLTWQPLLPAVPGAAYQLVLAEVKKGQGAVEALNYNLAIINQSNITAPVLAYPAIAKELEEGKTYTWQVTAYKNQTILNRSEVWIFTVGCKEPKKKKIVIPDDGYRDIEDLVKGNFYVAVAYLKFAVTNPYQEKQLKYDISSLNNPSKKIKGLPKITLTRGKNKVKMDLFNTDSFTDGESYLLKLKLPDGTEKSLRFIYKDE